MPIPTLVLCLLATPAWAQAPGPAAPGGEPQAPPTPPTSARDTRAIPDTTGSSPNGATPDSTATRRQNGARIAAPSGDGAEDRATERAGAAHGRLVLVETHTIGIDPVVGRVLNRELRKSAEAIGYQVIATDEARETMHALGITYPPEMAGLWRIAHRAVAERALLAVAWASGGQYVVQLRVASLDGSGPDYAQGNASAKDLADRVPALLAEALAPPGETLPDAEPRDLEADADEGRTFFLDEDLSSRVRQRLRRIRLALHGDSGFGIADDGFFNQLAGLRLDYRFGEELSLGGYLGYANLRGRDGRVSSLLPYVLLDNRVPIVPGGSVAIPLRIGLGYLVRNGMFLRLSAGLSVPLGERFELVFDLLNPTFWLTPDNTLFSLDLGVELAWKI